MNEATLKEITLKYNEIKEEEINTIYFGGGTPSMLNVGAIASFIEKLAEYGNLSKEIEITLEANPDDLTEKKLKDLRAIGINRLSIGTQSFDEHTLQFLNRAHNANEAKKSIEVAKKYFDNLSIDIIYGIHTQQETIFENDIETLLSFDPNHISAYSLTIEGNNAFSKWVKQGKMKDTDEELAITHFKLLTSALSQHGYQQYEISNFSKPHFESKHNTGYWFGKSYIGIGPSAHSFNGKVRSWNISNNSKYIQSIRKNEIPVTTETLSITDQINEYIMTRIRTMWGCDLEEMKNKFDYNLLANQQEMIEIYIKNGKLSLVKEKLILTETGKLLADKIASDLFITE